MSLAISNGAVYPQQAGQLFHVKQNVGPLTSRTLPLAVPTLEFATSSDAAARMAL